MNKERAAKANFDEQLKMAQVENERQRIEMMKADVRRQEAEVKKIEAETRRINAEAALFEKQLEG